MHDKPMKEKKQHKRAEEIRSSGLYKLLAKMAVWMDRYYIDPVLGIVPGGVGDTVSALLALPFVWFSMSVVRSVPLTLAIVYHVLKDVALGLIPFFVGDVLDILSRPYARNMQLVEGFLDGDDAVVKDVNRKAGLFAAAIVGCIAIIVALIWGITRLF